MLSNMVKITSRMRLLNLLSKGEKGQLGVHKICGENLFHLTSLKNWQAIKNSGVIRTSKETSESGLNATQGQWVKETFRHLLKGQPELKALNALS